MPSALPSIRVVALPLLLIAVGFMPSVIASPQVHSRAPGQTARDTASIEGRIVSATGARPLAEARVLLVPASGSTTSRMARSTDDGRYAFEEVVPGRYRILVERQGYLRQAAGGRPLSGSGAIYDLKAGSKVDIDVALKAYGVITGRTVRADGKPIPGLPVQLLQYRYFMGQRRLMPAGVSPSAITNDLGEYRIANISPGRYYALAAPQAMAPDAGGWSDDATAKGGVRTGLAQSYFPGSIEAAGGLPLDIGEGSELTGIDIQLQDERVFRVAGTVRHANPGQPLAGTMLTLSRLEGERLSLLPTRTGAAHPLTGRFELASVPAGSYLIVAQRQVSAAEIAFATVMLDDDVDGMELQLGGGTRLEVSTTRATEEGVTARDSRPIDLRVELRPEANPLLVFGMTAAPGGGEVRDLLPGPYVVRVQNVPDGWYLKRMVQGAADVLSGRVEITSRPSTLAIEIGRGGGALMATVTDGRQQAVGGALVTAVPVDPGRRINLTKVTTTDQDGLARLESLAPGQYLVLAWEDADPRAVESPDFLESFLSRAKRATITDGGEIHVSLTPAPIADVLRAQN